MKRRSLAEAVRSVEIRVLFRLEILARLQEKEAPASEIQRARDSLLQSLDESKFLIDLDRTGRHN